MFANIRKRTYVVSNVSGSAEGAHGRPLEGRRPKKKRTYAVSNVSGSAEVAHGRLKEIVHLRQGVLN